MTPDEITLDAIHAARERIADLALRTPLVRLDLPESSAQIWLKLENLQPIGSFKVRGAGNAMAMMPPDTLRDGVFTASAGNMAQGVAYAARKLGVPAASVVPEHAPQTKLDAIAALGATIVTVPYDEWWSVIVSHEFDGLPGTFIHPVCDANVIAGNGTIGLEILEDLPGVDTIIVPFGGGGLSSGISTAVRGLKPNVRVIASEVATAAPLAASLKADAPIAIDHVPSFVDGIGGKSVLKDMWPLVSELIDSSIVVSLEEIAEAIRVLVGRSRVVAEGAGASSLAAALSGQAGAGTIVCVISGGNIDAAILATILNSALPE